MTDLLIYETGNGGDLKLRGNDLAGVTGYESAVYLAMFGGSEKWWGNKIGNGRKYQSKTEQALKDNPLSSQGRINIENAVKTDMSFLSSISGTTYKVTTAITGPKRLEIDITINGELFSYAWNPDELFLTYRV